MKKNTLVFLFLLISIATFGQKTEKIKGSKIVTIEEKEIGLFNAIEISDNVEIYLDKGEKSELKIEADDNIHDLISIDLTSKTLRISTTKEITNFKKIIVRITYTNDLKIVTVKNKAVVNAIQEIQLNEISFESYDNSKLFLNVNTKSFTLKLDDNSKTEINLKTDDAIIGLSKNATLKALITTKNLKCDLYQKSKAVVEGEAVNSTIRLDNNAILTAQNFITKNSELLTEGYSDCSINVSESLILEASENSEITLYGDQKIEMKKFTDHATLSKKPTK